MVNVDCASLCVSGGQNRNPGHYLLIASCGDEHVDEINLGKRNAYLSIITIFTRRVRHRSDWRGLIRMSRRSTLPSKLLSTYPHTYPMATTVQVV